MTDIPNDPRSLSLVQLIKAMLRHWILIPGLMLLGLLGGLALLKVSSPSYQAAAKILIERRDIPFKADVSTSDQAVQIDDRYVESQLSVIDSNEFAQKVSEKLSLVQKAEPLKPPGALKSFLIAWGFTNDKSKLKIDQRVISDIRENTKIFGTPTSNIITVRVSDKTGETAAAVANAFADLYVDSVTGKDNPAQKRIQGWLSGQIAELRKKVSDSEAAVEKFRSNAGLLKGTSSTLGTEQVSVLNNQLSAAEAAESDAMAKAEAVKALLAQRGTVESSPEVINSSSVQQLQQQLILARATASELSATYLGSHPKLIAARQQVRDIEKQIRSETIKIVQSLDSETKVAAARSRSLRDKLDELKSKESEANLQDVKLKALEREASANRQLLETLLGRYVEINTRQDLDVQPTTATVVERAKVPPFVNFPKPGPIILLSTLGGLTVGMGLAFLFEVARAATGSAGGHAPGVQAVRRSRFSRTRSSDRRDQQQAVPVSPTLTPPPKPAMAEPGPVIMQEPALKSHADLDVVEAPAPIPLQSNNQQAAPSQAGSTDDSVEHELIKFQKVGVAANVSVSRIGCSPRESSQLIVATARALANRKLRVLVIDMDMERAELERMFEIPDGPGLLDLLAGQSDFARLICRDQSSSVQFIRLGDPANSPTIDNLTARLKSILNSLQGIYDFIFVHAGKAATGSLPLISLADVAVVLSRPTHDEETLKITEVLDKNQNLDVVHVALENQDAALQPA